MDKIKYIHFSGSTIDLSAYAYTERGEALFASTPMKGWTTWHEQPAFDLRYLPDMFETVLTDFEKQGSDFAIYGTVCSSWQPHEMVPLNYGWKPIIPALGSQCLIAEKQTTMLRSLEVEDIVGEINKNFILPKLLWAIEQSASFYTQIHKIITTADYIALCLTGGLPTLSSSNASNNGLLKQTDKTLADMVLQKVGISPKWFPNIVESGKLFFCCSIYPEDKAWLKVAHKLADWDVIAGFSVEDGTINLSTVYDNLVTEAEIAATRFS